MLDNDYELIYLAKEDDEFAIDELYKKYYQIIYTKAKKYSRNIDIEDLLNEARIAFYRAIDNYQDDNTFTTYLNICLESSLANYYKKNNRRKNKVLNEAIPLDDQTNNLLDTFSDDKLNPEKLVIEEYSYNSFLNKIISILTWKEELIFTLKVQDFTVKEISAITDYNIKTVYNIIKRVQNKVSKLM